MMGSLMRCAAFGAVTLLLLVGPGCDSSSAPAPNQVAGGPGGGSAPLPPGLLPPGNLAPPAPGGAVPPPPSSGSAAPAPGAGAATAAQPAFQPSVPAPAAQPAAAGAQPAATGVQPGVPTGVAGTGQPAGPPVGQPGVGQPGIGQPGAAPGAIPAAGLPGVGASGGQPDASQVLNQPGAVNAGDLPGLFRAAQTFRNQPGSVTGAQRFADKPVLAGYSWMVQLLPYLGHQELHAKFQFSKDWTDKDNLQLTGHVIPAFIDPANPQVRWVGFPFTDEGPGLTHYVGMSGAEDSRNIVAAALPRTDAAAGVFGYDQVARDADITDGTSNTVLIISAGRVVGPWVQGGGSTIRGAREPYFDDLTGFGSGVSPGSGVMVIFADGSSRILSKQMDPAVFRALCTIHGAETLDLNRLDAPAGAGDK